MASKSFISRALQLAPNSRAPKWSLKSSHYSTLAHPSYKTDLPWDHHNKFIRSYGQYAVDCHNASKNQDDKLQFVEMVKADGELVKGTNYYLVLKAKDQQGMIKPFRAIVWVDPFNQDGTRVTCTEFLGPLSDLSNPWKRHIRGRSTVHDDKYSVAKYLSDVASPALQETAKLQHRQHP